MITSPDDAALDDACADQLSELAGDLDAQRATGPREQLRLCGAAGVFRWFCRDSWGGQEWTRRRRHPRLPAALARPA